MKNIFIITNVLFFIMGNILFPVIHDLHNHDNIQLQDECEECLIIDNANNYISDFQELDVQFYKLNLLEYENTYIVQSNFNKKYFSRAPPIF